MENKKIKGSSLTLRHNDCAQLTQWVEITPLELKVYIESRLADPNEKVDYDKENECSLCMDRLYDDLQKKSLHEIVQDQKVLLRAKIIGRSKNEEQKEGRIDIVRLSNCKGTHFYHKNCLEGQYKSNENKSFLKCAVCGEIYGKQMGEMPAGTMTWSSTPYRQMPLDGFMEVDCPTVITIHYQIPSGLKNGVRFHGTNRSAYLPGNKQGLEVLSMLAEAFSRKLTFKVGTSITTGASNCVVWQGIHHKTSPSGGTSCFGYPDETYFKRVKAELEARGVTLSNSRTVNPTNGTVHVK